MKFKQHKANVFVKLYTSTILLLISSIFIVWAFNYEVDVEREVVGYYERDDSLYYIYLDGLGVRNEEIDKTDADYFKSKVGETVTVKAPDSSLTVISFMIFLISVVWWITIIIEEHSSISFSERG